MTGGRIGGARGNAVRRRRVAHRASGACLVDVADQRPVQRVQVLEDRCVLSASVTLADATVNGGFVTTGSETVFTPTDANASADVATIAAELNAGHNVTINSWAGGTTTIVVASPITKTAGVADRLTLNATGDVQINQPIV